jgi:hypothetical protein
MDNTVQRAFSMQTNPARRGDREQGSRLREMSQAKYGRPKADVEREILERSRLGEAAKKAETSGVEPSP